MVQAWDSKRNSNSEYEYMKRFGKSLDISGAPQISFQIVALVGTVQTSPKKTPILPNEISKEEDLNKKLICLGEIPLTIYSPSPLSIYISFI